MKNAVHNGSDVYRLLAHHFVFKNLPPELKLAMKMPYLVFFTV